VIDITDLGQIKAQMFQAVTLSNFTKDISADGTIDITDLGQTKANMFGSSGLCP
jgi:hypothetical protein